MTRFHSIMPALRVSDLDRSIAWYTGVLGFAASGRSHQDGGGEHVFLHAGPASLLLSTGPHLGDRPAFTGVLYFRVDGIASLFSRLSSLPEIAWPLEPQAYGTLEFGLRDPDGYLLAFAEPSL